MISSEWPDIIAALSINTKTVWAVHDLSVVPFGIELEEDRTLTAILNEEITDLQEVDLLTKELQRVFPVTQFRSSYLSFKDGEKEISFTLDRGPVQDADRADTPDITVSKPKYLN